MTLPETGNLDELVCRHSTFETVGDLLASCEDCDWRARGKQGSITAAARRHVTANPEHRVTTRRTQEKTTYMRPARIGR